MNQEVTIPKTDASTSNTFGKDPTDYMFIAEYKNGAWNKGELKRFQKILLSPFALCFHYGQTVFEGMKAFRMKDDKLNIFRPKKHYSRFNISLERMCMPSMPYEMFLNAVTEVVKADQEWATNEEDSALYLRPLIIASEEKLGVKISDEYLFIVMGNPAKKYYNKPIKVKVETTFTRASEGGTGFTKCGGNYGGAFYPTHLARLSGFDQVIWTDGHTHEFIEESGTMNLIFIIDGKLVTPALSGTILDGITRDSIITLAAKSGIPVEERKISVTELKQAFEAGKKIEAFGAGTAAVVAPIELIDIHGEKYSPYVGDDAVAYKLKQYLGDIRRGNKPDEWGWNHII